MESMGALAGGIAHDFNNILHGIVSYAELARAAAAGMPAVAGDLDRLLATALRGRDLVRRILTFSRRRDPASTPIHLDDAVFEALNLLRAALPSTIEIRTHLDPTTPITMCNETEIHQVVMNLAANASHAIGRRGGILDVTVAPVSVNETVAAAHPGLRIGLYARLTVADDGAGISAEALGRIFEPFYTTKSEGVGTGLGLSVIHGIVESHEGAIEAHSQVGQGTTFDIYLPAASDEQAGRSAARTLRDFEVSRRLILYLDDEKELADVGRRILEGRGFRVVTHTSSVRALEDFRSRPSDFSLVITDNTMPRMTGAAFAREVVHIRPDAQVIMVSGAGSPVIPGAHPVEGVRRFLPKPFTAAELIEAVTSTIGAEGQEG
jgi:CheY-like chemotaxis protein